MKWTILGMASIERKLQAERDALIRSLLPSLDPLVLPTDPTILLHPDDYATLESAVRSQELSMTDLPLHLRSSGLVRKGEVIIVPTSTLDPVKRAAGKF